MRRLSSEVAEASVVLTNELHAIHKKPTHANVLVDLAKKFQRLQSKARRQRRELTGTLGEIRITKKEMKALIAEMGKGAA